MATLSLGQNVKYTDENNNAVLAVIQAATSDGDIVISLPGGATLTVQQSDVSDELEI